MANKTFTTHFNHHLQEDPWHSPTRCPNHLSCLISTCSGVYRSHNVLVSDAWDSVVYPNRAMEEDHCLQRRSMLMVQTLQCCAACAANTSLFAFFNFTSKFIIMYRSQNLPASSFRTNTTDPISKVFLLFYAEIYYLLSSFILNVSHRPWSPFSLSSMGYEKIIQEQKRPFWMIPMPFLLQENEKLEFVWSLNL